MQVYERKFCYTEIDVRIYYNNYVWIALRTNYYVPLAAVILDITHELGSTVFRHCICIFVREYY